MSEVVGNRIRFVMPLTVGEVIYVLRRRAKLTPMQLARKADKLLGDHGKITDVTIKVLEDGSWDDPEMSLLIAIGEALGHHFDVQVVRR